MWWNKSKEEKFWEWFGTKADEYYRNLERDAETVITPELRRELSKVDPGLTFELGTTDEKGKHELTISADGIRDRVPLVKRLVEKAPVFEHWNIIAFRQRHEGLVVNFGDAKIGPDDIFFEVVEDGKDTVGIDVFVKGYDGSEPMMGAVFINIDCMLGEHDAMTRIGSLEIKPLPEEDRSRLKPIKELVAVVDAKKHYA
ncbi:MAG: hypothetical protein A3A33_04815 [Candidatus Yanofskybacteria bacterium RIFCSPLOWO2_01_FULL_49_25]|uniref:Uncharacterized protein n=1 Tax=Candidatus Yanofskybacteria bacterium RIFCSPLOWO2_01_FULL_49_25 TaxID=1802701 RepID=A0A1F8GQ15_9BACT|nr:MAG: hypothetical protein A3A33_04815 [Candidatus Yanofskybacteria bacterium RIFCSPLOWO2_01_FULL_49_25]